MSSTRRKGRSPVSPAQNAPSAEPETPLAAAATELPEETQPEADAPQSVEASADRETVQDTVAPPAEPAFEEIPDRMTETVEQPVAQAAEQVTDAVAQATELSAETVEQTTETVVQATEQATETAARTAEAAVEATGPSAEIAEQATQTVVQAAEQAVEAVPAPVPAAIPQDMVEGKPKARTFRVGASLVLLPALEPLNEINARLMAFARGEGEAAFAHLQALSKAQTPAEAIRLQVSELQRAADASLTCFSDIVRSANRLGGTGH